MRPLLVVEPHCLLDHPTGSAQLGKMPLNRSASAFWQQL
jgi:hypothetical protein